MGVGYEAQEAAGGSGRTWLKFDWSRSAGIAWAVPWDGWRFQPGPSLPLGGSEQKGITWSWGFGCRAVVTGCQEGLRGH